MWSAYEGYACADVYGEPDYVFTHVLGIPSILVPYANADESNHAPNENIRVENFMRGVKCCASVLQRISTVNRPATKF